MFHEGSVGYKFNVSRKLFNFFSFLYLSFKLKSLKNVKY